MKLSDILFENFSYNDTSAMIEALGDDSTLLDDLFLLSDWKDVRDYLIKNFDFEYYSIDPNKVDWREVVDAMGDDSIDDDFVIGESVEDGVSRSDMNVIYDMTTDQLEDLYGALDSSQNRTDGLTIQNDEHFKEWLYNLGFIPTDFTDEYVVTLMSFIDEVLEARQIQHDQEYYGDDYGDYLEDEYMAAWEDRYHMYQNEY